MKMAAFMIRLKDNEKAVKFMAESKDRLLNNHNFVENPFNGYIGELNAEPGFKSYAIVMRPIYPRFYFTGLFLMAIALFFARGFIYWVIPGLIIFSAGIFWSRFFFYFMLRLGLRKAGYKDVIRLLDNEEAIEAIVGEVL